MRKICNNFSIHILSWKLANKEGKLILGKIGEILYNKDKEEEEKQKNSENQFDEKLHERCEALSSFLDKMSEAVTGIE